MEGKREGREQERRDVADGETERRIRGQRRKVGSSDQVGIGCG